MKKKSRYNLICIVCGCDFISNIPHQVVCSKKCRLIHNRKLQKESENKHKEISKICEYCDKEYKTDREESRFCTLKCFHENNKRERLIVNCLVCEKEIEIIKDAYWQAKFCSLDCAYKDEKRKEIGKINGKLSIGRKHTEETLKKMSIAQKGKIMSEESKEKMSQSQKERLKNKENHPMFGKQQSKEAKEKISQNALNRLKDKERHPMFGKHHSKETKEKISNSHIGLLIGEKNPMYGKHHSDITREKMSSLAIQKIIDGKIGIIRGYYFSSKLQKNLYYRSSWEEKVFKMLDEDKTVVGFLPEPVSIVYDFDIRRHYVPDILIEYENGIKKIIEIKPIAYINYDINQSKFQAAQNYCQEKGYIFEVWTEKELKEMKLL